MKKKAAQKSPAAPEEIQRYLETFYDQHQAEWQAEIREPHPE